MGTHDGDGRKRRRGGRRRKKKGNGDGWGMGKRDAQRGEERRSGGTEEIGKHREINQKQTACQWEAHDQRTQQTSDEERARSTEG